MRDIKKMAVALAMLCEAPAFSKDEAAKEFHKALSEAVVKNSAVFTDIPNQRKLLEDFEKTLSTKEVQDKMASDAAFAKQMKHEHLVLAAPIVMNDLVAMPSRTLTGAATLKQSAEVAKAFGLEGGDIYSDAKMTLMVNNSNTAFDLACYLPFSTVAAQGKLEITRKMAAFKILPIKLTGEGDKAEAQIVSPTKGEKIPYTLISAHAAMFDYFQDKSFATDLNNIITSLRRSMVEGEIKALWEEIIIKPKLEHKFVEKFTATGNDGALDVISLGIYNAIANLNDAAEKLRNEYEKEITLIDEDLEYTAPADIPIIVYYNNSHTQLITGIERVSASDAIPSAPRLDGNFTFVKVRKLPACGAAVIDTDKKGRNGDGTTKQGFDAFKPATAKYDGAGVMLCIASPYNVFAVADAPKLGTEKAPSVQATSLFIHERLFGSMMKGAKMWAKLTKPATV